MSKEIYRIEKLCKIIFKHTYKIKNKNHHQDNQCNCNVLQQRQKIVISDN
jgi:hypothetical protein